MFLRCRLQKRGALGQWEGDCKEEEKPGPPWVIAGQDRDSRFCTPPDPTSAISRIPKKVRADQAS